MVIPTANLLPFLKRIENFGQPKSSAIFKEIKRIIHNFQSPGGGLLIFGSVN